jgi:hypothetical protein
MSIRQRLKTLRSGKVEIARFSWTKDERGIGKRKCFSDGSGGEKTRENSKLKRAVGPASKTNLR